MRELNNIISEHIADVEVANCSVNSSSAMTATVLGKQIKIINQERKVSPIKQFFRNKWNYIYMMANSQPHEIVKFEFNIETNRLMQYSSDIIAKLSGTLRSIASMTNVQHSVVEISQN